MAADYHRTEEFRGASFSESDFSGATFRDCDLRRVKIVDSALLDVRVAGEVRALFVNDVDVSAFVQGELDRRHPERVQLRAMKTADDFRAMWNVIERLWAETVERAARLPESAHHEQVDDEWSFVQTLRHLVFATDAWVGRPILDEPSPYHRLALPQTSYPDEDAAALGMELGARPSLAEIAQVHVERMARVRGVLDGLTEAGLERLCLRSPAPGYPENPHSVRTCLKVVMNEECSHRRYAVRDLAVLEAR